MRIVRSRIENLSQINHGMTGNGKCQFCLVNRRSVDTGHDQSADVQDGCECRKPRLIAVLRTIVGKYGVRYMTFQNFRGPTLPVVKEGGKLDKDVAIEMTDQ